MVSIEEARLDDLRQALARTRRAIGVGPAYYFKNRDLSREVRSILLAEIANAPIAVVVRVVRKELWPDEYLKATTGTDRINQCMVELVCADRPDPTVHRRYLIDGSRHERVVARAVKTALGRGLRENGHHAHEIRLCRDDTEDGQIIQVADIFAGRIRRSGGVVGDELVAFRSRLMIV
jgi:hypothetical protein